MTDAPTGSSNDAVGRALGSLDHLLDVFHDKVLRPIILVGRTVAFGLIIALVAVVAIVAVIAAAVRLLDVYAFPGTRWATDIVFGGVLVVGGFAIWSRRRPTRLRK